MILPHEDDLLPSPSSSSYDGHHPHGLQREVEILAGSKGETQGRRGGSHGRCSQGRGRGRAAQGGRRGQGGGRLRLGKG